MSMNEKIQRKKWHLAVWVIAVVILSAAGLLFIINELVQNRIYFLKQYEQELNRFTNQVGYFLEDMLQAGQSEKEVLTYIQNHVNSSGGQYPIFVKEGEILFVKDVNSTNKKDRNKEFSNYIQSIQKEFLISKVDISVNEEQYTFALVTHKNSLMNNWKVTKHEIYTFVAYAATVLILLAISVIAVTIISAKNKEIQGYKNKWIVQNKKLEAVVESLSQKSELEKSNTDEKEIGKFYDLDIINSLLRKSDRKELQPFYLMIIKLELENLYYSKQKIFDMIQPIQDLMQPNYIMAEAGKGEFVVLMYKANKSDVEALKKTIYEQGMFHIREEGIQVCLGYMKVKEQCNAIDVFQRLRDKLRMIEVQYKGENEV